MGPCVLCGGCKAPILSEEASPAERISCPECGSLLRVFSEAIAVHLNLRDSVGFKHQRPGHKRPLADGSNGWEDRRSVGDLVRKTRLIDRENDVYIERVETAEGEVIRNAEEKLSLHIGHGSDRARGYGKSRG